ncbi:4817_t:CDS:2, partial [Gigaspora rosea]
HDVDKYPPSMNKNLSWPPGAKPCALLKKEHDIHWLNLLRDMFDNNEESLDYSNNEEIGNETDDEEIESENE